MAKSVDDRNRATSRKEVQAFYRSDPKKYVAYLSGDASLITTWMGDVLAQVSRVRRSDRRGFYGAKYSTYYVWAVDDAGRWWSGRGPGPNMYIRLTRTTGRGN